MELIVGDGLAGLRGSLVSAHLSLDVQVSWDGARVERSPSFRGTQTHRCEQSTCSEGHRGGLSSLFDGLCESVGRADDGHGTVVRPADAHRSYRRFTFETRLRSASVRFVSIHHSFRVGLSIHINPPFVRGCGQGRRHPPLGESCGLGSSVGPLAHGHACDGGHGFPFVLFSLEDAFQTCASSRAPIQE